MAARHQHRHGRRHARLRRNATDPTKTTTLRREYARRLRGAFDRLAAAIREGIVVRDVFGLRDDGPASTHLGLPSNARRVRANQPRPPPVFRFTRDGRKQDAFMRWLDGAIRAGVLETVGRNQNPYVRQAYNRGLSHADAELRKQGISVPADANPFNQPMHRDAVEALYTRNFEELRGITAATSQQISRELSEGFAAGRNPRRIARDLTGRVSAVGKRRATVLARTEVINAHADATLNRYEQMGVGTVTIRAEFETAGDNRVCPVCADLEGHTVGIREMRTETFNFDAGAAGAAASLSGEYSIKPPIHPQCRCAILPVVEQN